MKKVVTVILALLLSFNVAQAAGKFDALLGELREEDTTSLTGYAKLAGTNTWTATNTFSKRVIIDGTDDKMLDVITTGTNGPAVRIVVPDSMAGNADCLLVEQADGTDIFKVDEDKDVYIGRNIDAAGDVSGNRVFGTTVIRSFAHVLADTYVRATGSDGVQSSRDDPLFKWLDTTAGENSFRADVGASVWALGSDNKGNGTFTDLITVTSNAANASVTTLTGAGGGILSLKECSAQPADPSEGHCVIWQSNGTGFGNDGDLCKITQAGGVLTTNTLSGPVYRGGASEFDYTNFTFDSSWHDLDLSAIVPQGARKVTIYGAVIDDTAGQQFRLRNNATTGSYVEAAWTVQVSGVIVTYAQTVCCDENRVVEYKCDPNLSNNSLLGLMVVDWE